jgi:hypothetical protein
MTPETIRDYTIDKVSYLDSLTARRVYAIICIAGIILALQLWGR